MVDDSGIFRDLEALLNSIERQDWRWAIPGLDYEINSEGVVRRFRAPARGPKRVGNLKPRASSSGRLFVSLRDPDDFLFHQVGKEPPPSPEPFRNPFLPSEARKEAGPRSTKSSRRLVRAVDELVLGAFGHPRPSPTARVVHLNGDIQDNRLENLEWQEGEKDGEDR